MTGTGKFAAELPSFGGDEAKRWKQLENYLYRLNEQLRFAFSNIQEDNLGERLREVLESKAELDGDSGGEKRLKLNGLELEAEGSNEGGAIRFLHRNEVAALILLSDTDRTLYINVPGDVNGFAVDIYAKNGVSFHEGNVKIGGVPLEDYIKAKAKEA